MDVKGEAKVYTSEGKLVLSKNLELRKGKNITKLDTHLFSAGIYILKLNGENFTKSLRFLVSK
jgi:ribosome-associated protein YbcJ (S4-like RNA binding protein)